MDLADLFGSPAPAPLHVCGLGGKLALPNVDRLASIPIWTLQTIRQEETKDALLLYYRCSEKMTFKGGQVRIAEGWKEQSILV